MAISDHDRYEMHKWFEEQAGPEVAGTVMAHLPPVGWADVATRRDLEMVEARMELRMDRLGDQLRAGFERGLRVQLLVILGFNLSMLAAVVALFR